MKTLIIALNLCTSLLFPVAQARTIRKEVPAALKLNKILHERLGTFGQLLNDAINKDGPEETLKKIGEHHKEEDRIAYLKVLQELKKQRVIIRTSKKGFVVVAGGEKLAVEVVDYISHKMLINGKSFQYKISLGFERNYKEVEKVLGIRANAKGKTSFHTFLGFFISDALAFVPIVIAAAGAVALIGDAVASPAANDIANRANHKVYDKIQDLKTQYEKRANDCESDLAHSYGMGKSELSGLSSVKTVGNLITELDAELYNEWFNGKSQIDYDDYSCKAYDGVEGIRNTKIIGIVSLGPGEVLKDLCHHQDRLNSCFSEIEEVMRKNNVQVNDVAGPDTLGPVNDIVEEYRMLHEAQNQ